MSELLSDAGALFILWLFFQSGWRKIIQNNNNYYQGLIAEYFNLENNKQYNFILLIKSIGVFELILSFCIIIPGTRTIAAIGVISILWIYFSIMAYQLYRGKTNMDCGCGGSAVKIKISKYSLIRNQVFTCITLLALMPGTITFNALSTLSLSIAMMVILINLCVEQLIANTQKPLNKKY